MFDLPFTMLLVPYNVIYKDQQPRAKCGSVKCK